MTCTHAPTINPGASLPALSLVVNVAEAAAASVTNTVTVSTPSYELVTANNTANDVTATLDPSVSTSTKSVVDLNGVKPRPATPCATPSRLPRAPEDRRATSR